MVDNSTHIRRKDVREKDKGKDKVGTYNTIGAMVRNFREAEN